MKYERRTGTDDWYAFYARLDHAIKNPLTVIYASVENLRHEPLSPVGQGRLDSLQNQADRLRQLLRGLRGVARLATIEMEEYKLDIVQVVEWTMEAAREAPGTDICSGHPLTLHWEKRSRRRPAVIGDQDYLVDALFRIIENACKFSPPGAPVEVWCVPEGDWLRIKVVDRGIGIPEEDLPHLGKELYRGESAYGTPGLGLGLARVRVILERHGGYLEVESKVGEGTAASLVLPLAGRRKGP